MSMLKMIPEGLKPQECEQVKLHKPPPVPYVPEKDEVQDEVSKKRNMEIKTSIKKRHYVELFRLARKRDTRRFFDARDCRARRNQETWSF